MAGAQKVKTKQKQLHHQTTGFKHQTQNKNKIISIVKKMGRAKREEGTNSLCHFPPVEAHGLLKFEREIYSSISLIKSLVSGW